MTGVVKFCDLLGKHSTCCKITWLILRLFIERRCVETCSKEKWFLCTSFSPLPHEKLLSVFGRDDRVHAHDAFHEGQLCSRGGVLRGTTVEKLQGELLHQVIVLESQLGTHGEGGPCRLGGVEVRSDTESLKQRWSAASSSGMEQREQRWQPDWSSAAGTTKTK